MVGYIDTVDDFFTNRINQIKERTASWSKIPTELLTVAWVFFLWGLGNLLFNVNDAADLGIIAVVLPSMALLFWFYPEYGVIALMFFTSGFLSPNFVDIRLPIGGGLEMPDLLLLMMLGLLFFQRLLNKNIEIPFWPTGGLLLLFLSIAVVSGVIAVRFEGVPTRWAFSELRILLFYLLFFFTAWSIRDEKSIQTIIFGTFVVADITAAIVILQQFLGPSRFLLASMSFGSWAIYAESGFTRVLPPGIVFLYIMFLISIGYMLFGDKGWRRMTFAVFQSGILGTAILLSFTRSTWAAAGIAVILMLLILLPYYSKYLVRILFVLLAAAMFVGGTIGLLADGRQVNNQFAASLIERVGSIFTIGDTLESNSLIWRRFEFQQGSKSIQEYPFFGVTLGNTYRPIAALQGEAQGAWVDGDLSVERYDRFTRYAHSSYLAIAIKMGLPALFILLWFLFSAIVHGAVLYTEIESGFMKGLTLALVTGLLGLLQWSMFHAQLFLLGSTPVVGLIVGLLAGIQAVHSQNQNEKNGGLKSS